MRKDRPRRASALTLRERTLREFERAYRSRDLRKILTMAGDLFDQSIRDGLTGLLNKRGFETLMRLAVTPTVDGVLHRAEQTERRAGAGLRRLPRMCVVSIDIDKLKELNGLVGHVSVDRILRTFAAFLLEEFPRQTDLIARTGGDEFVLVLPGAPIAIANEKLDRVARRLTSMDWKLVDLSGKAVNPRITFTRNVQGVDDPESYASVLKSIITADAGVMRKKGVRAIAATST